MEPRTYRHWVEGGDLTAFSVTVRETDLYIRAASNLQRKAHRLVLKYRRQLEKYLEKHVSFLTSLEPLAVADNAPHIVKLMAEAARPAGVGPMAAVAGAVAECVGRELLEFSPEIIVENGGDIFIKSLKPRVIGIYAGQSPLSGKIGLEIGASPQPRGICTSSGTVGHSLSYGQADAVVTLAHSAALADAAATAIGNRVSGKDDFESAIEFGRGIAGLKGILIIKGGDIGAWGEIKLCETTT